MKCILKFFVRKKGRLAKCTFSRKILAKWKEKCWIVQWLPRQIKMDPSKLETLFVKMSKAEYFPFAMNPNSNIVLWKVDYKYYFLFNFLIRLIKFRHSEKATKFCNNLLLDLTFTENLIFLLISWFTGVVFNVKITQKRTFEIWSSIIKICYHIFSNWSSLSLETFWKTCHHLFSRKKLQAN